MGTENQQQATGGQPPQGDGATQNAPGQNAPITLDDVNRAITGRLKSFEKTFTETVSKSLGDAFAGFEKRLDERAATATKTKDKPADERESPALLGLRKELDEQRELTKKIQAERDAEKERAADAAFRQQVADTLIKHGIDPARVKHAAGILIDVEGRVTRGEDGTATFKDDAGQTLDLVTGVKSWAKSPDGQHWIPPRGVAGSGDQRGRLGANQQRPAPGEVGALLAGALSDGMNFTIGPPAQPARPTG